MAAVEARGVRKAYGETVALDGVDLTLEAGELRGLLGPNGAGKTTLLRALFGLVRPDAGELSILGASIDPSGSTPPARVGGFVEDPTFYPYLSGAQNLTLLGELDARAAAAGARPGARTPSPGAIGDALERVGLTSEADRRAGGYSTGMRQRLGIAAALIRRPEVLLLDEPTSGLDPSGIRDVTRLLRELATEGVAILISSHLIGDLEAICHAYTVIRRGAVVWAGTTERLQREAPGSVYTLTTSDDARACAIAADWPGVSTLHDGPSIALTARQEALDPFTVALGRAGVAVRRLELVTSPLESLFFAMTA